MSKDVVITSRVRIMRNLAKHKFPTVADSHELISVMNAVTEACKTLDPTLTVEKSITTREREKFLAKRMISPNFLWSSPGRALVVSKDQVMSLMVNEEDHIRLQLLDSGEKIAELNRRAEDFITNLDLSYARSTKQGYLSTSVYNCGEGRRLSMMLHLVGLGYSEEKSEVFEALMQKKITVRGLFGEGSRPVGAFAQVSTTLANLGEFLGAIDYLVERELEIRAKIQADVLPAKTQRALDYLKSSPKISLPNAFRVLGWLRWSATTHDSGTGVSLVKIDAALNSLDLLMHEREEFADGRRADTLRSLLGI